MRAWRRTAPEAAAERDDDFAHLPAGVCYLDTACQTPRPQSVIAAEREYYERFNACGGRVKYAWGERVDAAVADARRRILARAGKDAAEYCVAFTLNTTYGINLVLHQLPEGAWNGLVTSEAEHNSVLVPAMAWAKRRALPLMVLPREDDGRLRRSPGDCRQRVVVLSAMSNIDGSVPADLPALAADVHKEGGLLLIDAAQACAHPCDLLRATPFDAAFGSGHKTYGPSVGFIIIRRDLLARLDPFFLGGGTVEDVDEQAYTLLRDRDNAQAVLEPGLQNWAGIVGLGAALAWLEGQHDAADREQALAERLWSGLAALGERVRLFNTRPSCVVSFHVDGLDAHTLAVYLSQRDILCRSGYFCCHRYLRHRRKVPPLLRASLGLHNTEGDIDRFLDALAIILSAL